MVDQLLRRIACLVEIADRKKGLDGRLGKTAMQKLIYLLQSLHGIRLGYKFEFYTYGPYDSGVMSDINYGAATGLLDVKYEGDRGYLIAIGPKAKSIDPYRIKLREEAGEEISELLEKFGNLNAGELELRATMVFAKRDDPTITDERLVDVTKNLKPKFDESQIKSALEELKAVQSFEPDTIAS